MHTDSVASKQVGVRVLANRLEQVDAERLSIRLDSPVAAKDHRRVGPSGKASEARFNRVRLQSVISVEKGDIPGTGEPKACIPGT